MPPAAEAFTLVELLIVIGIIALLISILLPSLSAARKEAKRVACLSNLKQIMTATVMYESENRNYLPFAGWGNNSMDASVYKYGWLFTFPTATFPPKPDDVKSGELYPYLKTPDVYHCPQWDPTVPVPGTEVLTSYLMNGAAVGYGALGRGSNMIPSYPVTMFPHSSELILYWEADEGSASGGYAWNDSSSYPWEEGLADRHKKGANVAFLDGHVDWMDPASFNKEKAATGRSMLWWSPASANGH